MLKKPASNNKDVWLIFIIFSTTACSLVLASLLGVVALYHRRQKKLRQRRQHQLCLSRKLTLQYYLGISDVSLSSQLTLDWWNTFYFLEVESEGSVPQTKSTKADRVNARLLPCPDESEFTNVASDSVHQEEKKNVLDTSDSIQVFLLYRRDNTLIAQHAIDLQNRLRSECGSKIKVLNVSGLLGRGSI